MPARGAFADGPEDEPEDDLGVFEPDLRLGRMDVDVDVGEGQPQEEEGLRRPAPLEDARIGLAQRRHEDPVLDRTAVDEEVLDRLVGAPGQRQRGQALDPGLALLRGDVHEAVDHLLAEDLEDPLPERRDRRAGERLAGPVDEREPDAGRGQRGLGHVLGHGPELGLARAEELPPRRQVEEEVADLDARAPGEGDVRDGDEPLPFPLDHRPAVARAVEGPQGQPGDRGDAGQRFAPEAEGRDPLQVLLPGDLARRVPAEAERGVLAVHARAVVLDLDQALAAVDKLDPDLGRPGVERVLDELLDDRDRPSR